MLFHLVMLSACGSSVHTQQQEVIAHNSDQGEDSSEDPLGMGTSGLKIGFIGESHSVGAFGSTLMKALSHKGDVRRLAIGGSSSFYWNRKDSYEFKWGFVFDEWKQNAVSATIFSRGSKISLSREVMEDFFAEGQFDVVIIQLMDNQLSYSASANSQSIQDLLKSIRQSNGKPFQCFFVSATHKDIPGIYPSITNKIKRNFIDTVLQPTLVSSDCQLVDSMEIMPLSQVHTTDGLHLDSQSGSVWGQLVGNFIDSVLGNND